MCILTFYRKSSFAVENSTRNTAEDLSRGDHQNARFQADPGEIEQRPPQPKYHAPIHNGPRSRSHDAQSEIHAQYDGPALIALMDAPNPPLLKDLLGAKDKMLAINSTNMTLAYHLSIHALRRGIAACIGKHLHLCLPTREEQPLRKRKHRNLSCRNVMTQATERHSFPGARGEGGRARLSSALAQSLTSAIISSAHLAVVMVCSRALGRRIPGTREAHHVAGHGVEARAKS